VLPEAFCLIAGALKQSRFVLEGLEVDPKAMRRNIDMTHGLVMSEWVQHSVSFAPVEGRSPEPPIPTWPMKKGPNDLSPGPADEPGWSSGSMTIAPLSTRIHEAPMPLLSG